MAGPDLLRTFEVELRKSARAIQEHLLALNAAGPSEARQALHEAYRLTHSVKGASRVVGLSAIEELAHRLEDRLQTLVRDKALPTSHETTVFLDVVDGFEAALDAFLSGSDFDAASRTATLRRLDEAEGGVSRQGGAAGEAETAVPGSRGLLRATEGDDGAVPEASPSPSKVKRDELLSIPAERVDEAFRYVEEAFLIEARVRALALGIEEEAEQTSKDDRALAPALRREVTRLHHVLLRLHDVVRLMRMEPLEGLRIPLQRAVRELGSSLRKELRFSMQGRQEMVDASILDALQEPLLHLVRNAVDHGVEPPGEREAAGKPRQASVEVSAAVKGGTLEIEVRDDGRGVSAETVRRKAVQEGLVGAEQTASWTPAQCLDLVFRAGFSTAAEVSSVSGRGMGLDIVRERVRALGGEAHLSSVVGQGARFELRVPIRLLTARTLLVRCGDHRAGIPIADVSAVFALKKGNEEDVRGSRLVRWNGTPVTLEPLGTRLGWENDSVGHGHVVVMSAQSAARAFLVDEVIGEIEQPAVPPPSQFAAMSVLTGVIVLGDGEVVPLLDARELVRAGASTSEPTFVEAAKTRAPEVDREVILIVDDSPTVRALHRSAAEEAGYRVLTADDGVDALAQMEIRAPDLVVTDVQMPRMDGLTLVRRIRERASWRRLPIVVVSQYGRQEDLQKAAALGADRYIVKSAFQAQEFIAVIGDLLGK
jgi:two-component system chemotaxis sensor kinase CheA